MATRSRKRQSRNAVPSVADEFATACLGDARLAKRLLQVSQSCSAAPDRSFPDIAGTVAELEGLYRFMSNDRVVPEEILEAHARETVTRAEDLGTLLVVHDTTEFAFPAGGARDGLGRLRSSKQGFLFHASLAVSCEAFRKPLGLLHAITWTRKARRTVSKARRDDGARESARWDAAVIATNERLAGRASAIHVMDREGDSFPLLAAMAGRRDRFIVRVAQADRIVVDNGERVRLCEAAAEAEEVLEITIELSKRRKGVTPYQRKTFPPRDRRSAVVRFAAKQLSIQRPRGRRVGDLPKEVAVNIVHVWEPSPPDGCEPVDWMLFTSESIRTKKEIRAVVERYRARWVIEEFFKVLKTGCAYEERQLASYHALRVALMIFVPIACRLIVLRAISRSEPDLPATVALSKTEIDVLRHFSKRVRLGKAPTVREALLAIAGFGGHLKNNGDPGWLTLSRGMEKLLMHTEGWEAALRAVGIAAGM